MGQAVSFDLGMDHKLTQVTKTGEGTPRRSQEDHSKNHFFKDFDEFHNFGLELQTKAKGKIITNNVSLIHLYNTCYITLTQFSSKVF